MSSNFAHFPLRVTCAAQINGQELRIRHEGYLTHLANFQLFLLKENFLHRFSVIFNQLSK